VKALMLAAGQGTRLRPLTLECPKPMLSIGGRPILEHIIAHLRKYDITEVAINLNYRPEAIVDYFGDGHEFGVSITYSYEEQLLGSAGAARALDWFFTDMFVVWYGDVLSDLNLTELMRRHLAQGAAATLALYEVDEPERCGIVQIDRHGWITRFIEKPPPDVPLGNLANAGIYIVEPALLRWIPADRTVDFGSELFPRLLAYGAPLLGVKPDAYVLDVGSVERYQQANVDLRSGRFCSSLLAQT
jgi:mannose-1-phosphate guanylyltransferase